MFKYKNGEFYLSEDNPSDHSDYSRDRSDYLHYNSYSDDYKQESYKNTPKIIHQTWKNKELPEKLENWRNMWLEMCPDYKHVLYDDKDIENLMKEHFPQYMKDFNRFTYNIERVDFWRCAVLYVYGGVYADLDVFPMKSIDIFLEKNKVILGREPIEHARNYNGTDFLLCNAFMISPKKDKFWLDMMDYIIEKYKHGNRPVDTTGPGIMNRFYREHPEKFKNVIITEPNSFYPITFNKSNKIQEYKGKIYKNVSEYCDMKDAYVVHMWEGSWSGNLPEWGISMIEIGIVAIILLVFLFSISISMGKTGKNKTGIKNYEITFTVTTLIILGIIFLVIWLDNNEDKEFEEKNYEVLKTDFVEIKEDEIISKVKLNSLDFYNVSVLKKKRGYEGVIRSCTNGPAPYYSYPFYIKLSDSGKLENIELIKLNYEDMKGCQKQLGDVIANGVEDPKIFIFRNEYWVGGNSLGHKNQKNCCVNQMCLFKIKDPRKTFILLDPPIDKTERQKNWTFFENNGELLCEYSLSPHIIFKIDTKSGRCKELCRTTNENISDIKIEDSKKNNAYRLNANPIYLEKEKVYLGIGHIRGNCDYLHFFYTFENKYPFKILNVSKEFKLESKEKIQFVGGISEYESNIYVSYGINDNHNKISIFTLEEVLELLEI